MNQERDNKPARRPGRGPGMGPPMGRPVEKAKDFKNSFRRLLTYLKPYKVQLITVLILAIFSTVFSILAPKLMGKITTKLFEGIMKKRSGIPQAKVDFGYILNIIMILAGLYFCSALFSYWQHFIMAGVAQKTVYKLRNEINEKMARLPLKFFDTHTTGEILSRVTNDVDTISSTLQQSLTQLITAAVTLIGIVIMMLTISPLMTLICFIILPLSVLVTKFIAPRSQKYFAKQQESLGELNGHIEEMYTGHTIIKAFGQEHKAITEFNAINEKLYEASWKAHFMSGIMMPLMGLINNMGYVLICVVGGIFVTKKRITMGDVQAFIQYARQFTQPIVQTANIANILQSTVASAERVFELLDQDEEIQDRAITKTIASPNGNVKFENVKFSYKKEVPLIDNMNIEVQKGQTVAIVGPTGAGKTTLVNLLMRFYEIEAGKITIDGININDLQRSHLRSIFGMVLQDTWLFNGTIKDNIAYGKKGATFKEVVAAAKAAHADHFIRTFPDGYNTVLNEEATNISQGQKQLLTIARAILADPAILILDEATSSVDTRTEIFIQKAMTELMKGKTSFVIAHRLSTIRNADLILVMDNGSIIETGNHHDLLAKGGLYADLYNSQFAGSNMAG